MSGYTYELHSYLAGFMIRSFSGMVFLSLVLNFASTSSALATSTEANTSGEASLLSLCESFGETTKECKCYMGETKKVYSPADIELGGSVARAFMKGEEPEAIAAYLLLTRKITLTRVAEMYKLGDKHTDRVAKKCEDRKQKITAETKASRKAMAARLEKIGTRYGIGSKN